MRGSLCLMVNDKMCVGVDKDDIMIRCEPEMTDELLKRKGVRLFDLGEKPMKGWLRVAPDEASSKKDFDGWIKIAQEANKKVVPAKKKK